MGTGYRIVLADDHQIVREGIRALLERHGHQVCAEADDGHAALMAIRKTEPDIALVDFSMPKLNGLDAIREIPRHVPTVKAMLLTMHADQSYVLEALRAGARAYVLKTQAAEDLAQAIEDVMHGKVYLSPGVVVTVVDAYLNGNDIPEDTLTGRERQVLQLVAEGHTTKKIADMLNISFKTAESHRNRIMNKLDIHQTAGLVCYAIRKGLLDPWA
ncbi:MAG: response regulator transcription factor [Aquisalimonadaceae bacterium]